MKTLIVLCSCVLFSAVLSGQIQFEHEEWARVREQAKATDRIIFVDAYTTWCGPCKWMAKNVFTDADVATFYNEHFINLKLDMEKGEGLDFARTYKVNAYPSLLYLDGDGNLLHKHLGAVPADRFLEVGRDALDPEKRIAHLMSEYDTRKNDKDFLRMYSMKMAGAGMDVSEAVDAYFGLLDDNEVVSGDNLQIIQMTRPSLDSRAFEMLYTHRAAFGELVGQEVIDGLIRGIAMTGVHRGASDTDEEVYRSTMSKVRNLGIAEKDMLLTLGEMVHSEAIGDIEQYITSVTKYSKEYHWNDANALNNIAWEMYLNEALTDRRQLKTAEMIAKRSVKLDANAYSTDTYAAVLYKMGKYRKALKWANTAVDMAKAASMDHSSTTELIDKINAAR